MTATSAANAFAQAVRDLEAELATLRERVDHLERERRVADTPAALLSLKAMTQRHPAFTEEALRGLIKRRDRNGLKESGALIRAGRRVLIHEQRFIAWAEELAEGPPRRGSARLREVQRRLRSAS